MTVNGLWLWGGGRLPASAVTSRAGRYFGDDPLGRSLAHAAGISIDPLLETYPNEQADELRSKLVR